MYGIENYIGFLASAIVLNLTLGLDTIYILTRSLSQGKSAGLVSVAGIMSGCVIHVLCAAFGLSLILSTSALIFSLIKWAGAGYLIYLGIRIIFSKQSSLDILPMSNPSRDLVKIYKQGVLTTSHFKITLVKSQHTQVVAWPKSFPHDIRTLQPSV